MTEQEKYDYDKPDRYKIMVKVVDILGIDISKIIDIVVYLQLIKELTHSTSSDDRKVIG